MSLRSTTLAHLHIVACVLLALAAVAGAHAATSVVRIPLKGPYVLQAFQERGLDILALNRDGTVDVAADEKQVEYLFSLGLPASVIATPDMVSASIAALDANLGLYHTYAEMDSVLAALATAHPTLASVQTIGQSIEGRNIYVLKISDNVLIDEDEPEVFYMGNHHAREIMSVDITLRFAVYLLANYGTDPTVTAMVDAREIFVAPMINPDGHVFVEQNHAGDWWTWWRKNRRNNGDLTFGVDLNRNYGFQWGFDNLGSSPSTSSQVYRGSGAFSEPETQAVRDFCIARDFSLAFSYHAYGELLLYGWGYIFDYTPDHDVFLALGDTLTSSNGYFAGNAAMGAIYLVNGDVDDWAYGDAVSKNSFFSFTPEVNTQAQGGFGPPDSLIQPTFDLLLPMNMLLLQLADNPQRVIGPRAPALLSVDNTFDPNLTLSWSGNDPSDPNPVVGYEVVEYKNLGFDTQDPANAASPLWNYDGFSPSTARAFEGSGSYFSGAVNNTTSKLEAATFYRVTAASDTFSAWVWYNLEFEWDYGYLEVSTDGGVIWSAIPGNLTTNLNPNGNNRGNGFTGASPGWVNAIFPLTAYLGVEIQLRFNYITDAVVLGEGLYVDLPGPVPSFDSTTVVASNLTGTGLVHTPAGPGDFTYRVRGRDAENQAGLWSPSATATVINVATGIGDVPAISSHLGPNFPNPFNPVTRIPYTVTGPEGRALEVTLAVYDVSGARVATLVRRDLAPGIYQAVWAGVNHHGAPMASGVYFARLTVDGESAPVRKIVLLK